MNTTEREPSRDDEHRRGIFRPEMYRQVGWYYLRSMRDNDRQIMKCEETITKLLGTTDAQDYKAMEYGDFGKCAVCGARFAIGAIWQHTERFDPIHIGHDCAAKYSTIVATGTDWDAVADERRRALLAQKTHAKNVELRAAIMAAYPGLENVLQTQHHIVQNMRRVWERGEALTVRVVEMCYQISKECWERAERQMVLDAQRAAEVKATAPVGRVTVQGRVVKMADHESQWGMVVKLTVKCTTEAGVWLCWATRPTGLTCAVGDEIRFDATLEPGREPHFAFAKRPTKAVNLTKEAKS